VNDDDLIIEAIIKSLKDYALGDVEYNVNKKPIAAFILSSCLIDQLSSFVYNDNESTNSQTYKRFIKEYLPQYIPLNLWVNLRNKLVHGYSISHHIKLTSEDAPYENTGVDKKINVITAKMMYSDLSAVLDKIVAEFKNQNNPKRQNAINRYRDEKIIGLVVHKFTYYLEHESDLLINYFSRLIDNPITYLDKILTVHGLYKKAGIQDRFLVYAEITFGKKNAAPQIDELIAALGLETSQSVLNRLDYKK